jgi:hypothetical protein
VAVFAEVFVDVFEPGGGLPRGTSGSRRFVGQDVFDQGLAYKTGMDIKLFVENCFEVEYQ